MPATTEDSVGLTGIREEHDRPSRHGKILGEALAAMAQAGRCANPDRPSDLCATCAFRSGSMPNQMASTGLLALNTTLGVDPDDFACHHGMTEGWPTRLCRGYLLAKLAPWPEVKSIMEAMKDRLDQQTGSDEVRATFDEWLRQVDPDGTIDPYRLARMYAARSALTTDPQQRGDAP